MAKILIVDDEPDGREFLVKLFRYKGHTSLEAVNGAEALAVVKKERPDLVITDVLMPIMDGYQFVRQLRLDAAVAATEVIFYSASYHYREARLLAEDCGVVHLLPKPTRPDVMLDAVNEILSNQVRPVPPAPAETFDREHLTLITNQLAHEVNQLKETNARLTALLDLSRDMVAERNLGRLLERFADTARELIAAQYAAIGVVNGSPERFRSFLIRGLDAEQAVRLGQPTPGEGIFGAVLTGAQRLRFRDIQESPYPAASWKRLLGVRSLLGVPVASSTRCYGVLALMNKIGAEAFDEEDEHMVSALAAQLAVVYESKCAGEALQDHVHRLESMSKQLMRVQEEERRNLARELHDELGQVLTATSINLQVGLEAKTPEEVQARLQESVTVVDRALEQVRNLSLNLRPSILDDLGLEAALDWLCERQAQRTGLPIHCRSALAGARLPSEIETACFRIAQESLTNAIRHARAHAVTVEVEIDAKAVRLLIRDNGIGFDVALALAEATHGKSGGLLGMKERAELLGGHITFESEHGRGAIACVSFPLRAGT